MRKEILLLGFLFCLISSSFAQKDKDFILTLHKDTLFGKIKLKTGVEQHITFTYNKKRVNFHPASIQYFGIYKNGKYLRYKSVKNRLGKSLFVQVLQEGKVKLYKYQQVSQEGLSKLTEDCYFIGRTGKKLVIVTAQTYERSMKALLKNHPQLIAKVEDSSFRDVPKLVDSFNRL